VPPDRTLVALRAARQVLLALIIVAIGAVFVQYHASVVAVLVTDLHLNDFGKFYWSARYFLDGLDMYGPSRATYIPVGDGASRHFWNLNPPHFHLLLLPLAPLAPIAAFVVWAIVNAAALAAAVASMTRELGIRWTRWRVLLTLLAVTVLSPSSAVALTGQMTCLLLLAMTVAWRWARRGRWTRAGVLLGVLASVKPFLGVFLIYLAATGRRPAALAMAGAAAACFALGLLVFGVGAHASWLEAASRADWTWGAMNGSIAGLAARVLDESPYFAPLAVAPEAGALIYAAIAAAVAVGSGIVLLRVPPPLAADAAFAVLPPAALLIAPMGWVYYLPLAAPAILALWRSGAVASRVRDAALALAAPGLVLPVGAVLLLRDSAWGTATLGSAYFWTTLWLWIALVAHLGPGGAGAPDPRGRRLLGALAVGYAAAYLALAVAGQQFFIFKTMVMPAFVLYALGQAHARRFAIDWLPFLGATVLFDALRGAIFALVEAGVRPVFVTYAIDLDAWLFGTASVPTAIQAALRSPVLDRVALLVHGSHFVYFLFVGLVIWQARREAFWQYRRVMLGIMGGGLVGYLAMPTAPPWMAARDLWLPPVTHVTAEAYASVPALHAAFDTNPVAAMPSLHAAFPLACAALVWRLFGWRAGALASLYAALVCFSAVYLGEHYLVDLLAGGVLAASAFALLAFPHAPRGDDALPPSLLLGVVLVLAAAVAVVAAGLL
jgi:membrane-associated phospholipid phosphatase